MTVASFLVDSTAVCFPLSSLQPGKQFFFPIPPIVVLLLGGYHLLQHFFRIAHGIAIGFGHFSKQVHVACETGDILHAGILGREGAVGIEAHAVVVYQ